MRKVTILLYTLLILWGGKAMAQQDPHFSQFMYNGLFYNPAFAGLSGGFSAAAFFRSQWSGFAGAPVTQTLIASMPLENKKLSFGLDVSNDQAFVRRFWGLRAAAAYRFEFEKNLISIGLNVGMRQFSIDLSGVESKDVDPTLSSSALQAPVVPDLGLGVVFKNKEDKFYVGVSAAHIYQARVAYTSGDVGGQMRMQFYLNAGYKYNLSPSFKLIPSVLMKYNLGAPFQTDVNVSFLFQEKFWFGASYRTADATIINLGVQLDKLIGFKPRIKIGYAFDATVSRLPQYNQFGSHEVFMAYDVGFAEKVHIPKFKKLE